MIAEKVMGWSLRRYGNGNGDWLNADGSKTGSTLETTPRFSTKIDAAFLVVEKMRDLAYMLNLHVAGMTNARFVHFSDDVGDALGEHAESSALAICLAALASLSDPPITQDGTK